MNARLAVTALGLASPLGNAVQGCAAARAGLSRPGALEGRMAFSSEDGDMVPLLGHSVPAAAGFVGASKVTTLVVEALHDIAGQDVDWALRTGLVLTSCDATLVRHSLAADEGDGLPPSELDRIVDEWTRDRTEAFTRWLQPSLERAIGGGFRFRRRHWLQSGQTGLAEALEIASSWIAAGEVDQCLVGGADSLIDPVVLDMSLVLDLVKTPDSPSGFLPGEAAALLLVEGSSRRSMSPLGMIETVGFGSDQQGRFAPATVQGVGLAQAVSNCMNGRSGDSAGVIIVDQSGDTWKAHEWGSALVRMPEALRECEVWYPATSFGEIGAASAPVGACMAFRGWSRGYVAAEMAIVLSSAYSGRKSAISCTRPGTA